MRSRPYRPWFDAMMTDIREEMARSAESTDLGRKRRKLQALLAPGSGATDGERAAAEAGLARLRGR